VNYTEMRLAAGLSSARTRWGSYSDSPDLLAVIRGRGLEEGRGKRDENGMLYLTTKCNGIRIFAYRAPEFVATPLLLGIKMFCHRRIAIFFLLILTVKQFRNRLIFDKVEAFKNSVPFFSGPPCSPLYMYFVDVSKFGPI